MLKRCASCVLFSSSMMSATGRAYTMLRQNEWCYSERNWGNNKCAASSEFLRRNANDMSSCRDVLSWYSCVCIIYTSKAAGSHLSKQNTKLRHLRLSNSSVSTPASCSLCQRTHGGHSFLFPPRQAILRRFLSESGNGSNAIPF